MAANDSPKPSPKFDHIAVCRSHPSGRWSLRLKIGHHVLNRRLWMPSDDSLEQVLPHAREELAKLVDGAVVWAVDHDRGFAVAKQIDTD